MFMSTDMLLVRLAAQYYQKLYRVHCVRISYRLYILGMALTHPLVLTKVTAQNF